MAIHVHKDRRKHGCGIFVFLVVILGGLAVLFFFFRNRTGADTLTDAWKAGDAAAFRMLVTDQIPAGGDNSDVSQKETQAEAKETQDKNLKFLSEEEYNAAVGENTSKEERGTDEPDLLRAMMRYGTLEVVSTKGDEITLKICVPDTTVLVNELVAEETDVEKAEQNELERLIAQMESKAPDFVMKESEVTVTKVKVKGESRYFVTDEFLDALYGGLLSGLSSVREDYYQKLGGAVR